MLSAESDDGVVAGREPPALDRAARIGRYVILERVGSGAMGVVYGAYDPELDRKIALKLLKNNDPAGQNETARARLLREAKAMARLVHTNVIAVHDFGVFEGKVFLAMDFVGGGTLGSWLSARQRPVREVLAVFAAAGRGLLAAHNAGLVHRDFKPENVLLDKEARPRVVDFGLAREAGIGPVKEVSPAAVTRAVSAPSDRLDTITRSGAVMGTPAYMAPEQFLDEATDARTDQFSFCVALYEALHGARPFAGDSVLQRLNNIDEGRFQPVPEDRKVPAWVRRAVLRGLRSVPTQRWPSMAPLIAALEDDPPARHRRRILAAAVLALVIAAVVGVVQLGRHRRLEIDRQVSAHLADAVLASDAGKAKDAALRETRRRAFAAFDAADRARGEALWREALAMVPAADAAYERAARAFERALVLDPARDDLRAALGDLLYQHLLFARELRRDDQARALAGLLEPYDEGGRRRARLQAPGTMALHTTPATATVSLEQYEREPATGRRVARPVPRQPAPGAPMSLGPGSYRALVSATGYADVAYPFEVDSGVEREATVRLPLPAEIPPDFVFVPAGDFWFGDGDENLRNNFLDTVPLHRRHASGFLIARHETTYRQWIDFLTALPEETQARYAPEASAPLRGSVRLRQVGDDREWQLIFQPTGQRYTARQGQPFVYAGRDRRARQDWLEFPVAGTAPADVERYLRWLRETGRVPGARLCTEIEWERAGRGADDRVYPHGDELGPDDANFDVTYGRIDSAFGPDMVGAHAASRSPFGVDDLAGNVLELVRSSVSADGLVIRGGAYYFNSATCRLTNRNPVSATFRDVTSGIRVCAPAPGAD